MTRTQRLTLMLVAAYAVVGLAGCGGDSGMTPSPMPQVSGMTPSPMPQVIEGTVAIPAIDLAVVSIQIDRQGTLSSSVDWTNANNDIDSGLVPGTCTVIQILSDAPGCAEADILAFEESQSKPSVFTASVAPGAHTLALFNLGPEADTVSYRLEIN